MFNPVKFIQQTKDELKKVTWPTREKTIRLTGVVIIVSLIVSTYLGALDLGFNELLKIVINLK